jgi:hypothetical protein
MLVAGEGWISESMSSQKYWTGGCFRGGVNKGEGEEKAANK